jgi:hypothetical protein
MRLSGRQNDNYKPELALSCCWRRFVIGADDKNKGLTKLPQDY